jgi:hypothetical protein
MNLTTFSGDSNVFYYIPNISFIPKVCANRFINTIFYAEGLLTASSTAKLKDDSIPIALGCLVNIF